MASIYRSGKGWRAQVCIQGVRDSDSFRTKQEAAQWALQRESELSGEKLPDHSLADAMKRYKREEAPKHRGSRWEITRIDAMLEWPLTTKRLAALKPADFAEWRDARLKVVSPGTVVREMNLMRSILRTAWRQWHWLKANPMEGTKPPKEPPSRKRRISADEIGKVLAACEVSDLECRTALQRTGLAFAFALETAMRAGEIVGMRWSDVREKSVRLPVTKNGDARDVPLSPRARQIISALPRDDDKPVFSLDPGTRDVMFRRAKAIAKVENLRFHDSRAEAIWRLSKKLDVLELARVIGHRDIKSLMIYYQASADELADKL